VQHVTNYDADWDAETLNILRDQWNKITADYIQWRNAGDDFVLARLDAMMRLYARRFILDDMPAFRPLMGISVTGDIYPYPGAVGNEVLRVGDVFNGFDPAMMQHLTTLPKVPECEGCDIFDICPSAKGNVLLDNLQPHSHPVSCESYKVMIDCAEDVLDAMISHE